MESNNLHAIEWLVAWYQSKCNGDWEHQHGVEIGTLDNPGWYMKVDIDGTPMAGAVLPQKLVERTETDWVEMEVKDNMFLAHGGPGNLLEMIAIFAEFMEGRLSL